MIIEFLELFTNTALAATSEAGHAAASAGGGNVLDMFGVNVPMFIGQLINFAVIIFLLWKWVFGPITKKLSERQDLIEKNINDHKFLSEEKKKLSEWKEKEMVSMRTQAAEMIQTAQKEAEEAKNKILEATKEQQQKLIAESQAAMQDHKQTVMTEVKSEVADLVVGAVKKVFAAQGITNPDIEKVKISLKEVIKK